MNVCQISGCEKRVKSRGMCHAHYEQMRRKGWIAVNVERDPVVRFWKKVAVVQDACWTWTAATSTGGYGRVYFDGRLQQAHRVAYELLVGPIPEGLHLDHLCRNRRCVNPSHLEAVTPGENVLRGVGVAPRNKAATHCPAGHEYTPENTRISAQGHRLCRACGRIRSAASHKKRQPHPPTRHGVCLMCGKEFAYVGRATRRMCSDACSSDRKRQHSREHQRRKRAGRLDVAARDGKHE